MDIFSPRDKVAQDAMPASPGVPTSPGSHSKPASGNRQLAETTSPKRNLQDDDLALARILQEQERALYLLQVQSSRLVAHQAEPAQPAAGQAEDPDNLTDEEFARRLQHEEQMENWRQMYAAQGLDVDNLNQEIEDGDTEALGYEDLTTLGEVAGHVSKGLPAAAIAALPVLSYTQARAESTHACDMDRCCICQVEFEGDDEVTPLPCRHVYHQECAAQWLAINKVCPVCNKEVPKGDSA